MDGDNVLSIAMSIQERKNGEGRREEEKEGRKSKVRKEIGSI